MPFKPRKQTSRTRRSTKRRIESLEARQLLTTYTGGGGAIGDNTTTNFTLDIAESVQIADVDVQVNIQHTRDADLDVFLLAPDGARVELFTDVGGNGDNFAGTILDDEAGTAVTSGSAPFAGSYRPEGSLSDFDGKDSAGTWTLEIEDDRRRRAGQLMDWSVTIESAGPPTISISDATAVEGDADLVFLDRFISDSGLTQPLRSQAFGPDGNGDGSDDLYVVSGGTDEVLRFDGISGGLIDVFVSAGSGGLDDPVDLRFGPDGHLYVTSGGTNANPIPNEILRYNGQTGAFIDTFVIGLGRAISLDFGDDGDLYVGNRDTNQVLRFDGQTGQSSGVFVGDAAGVSGSLRQSLFVNDANNDGVRDLYVLDAENREVLHYDGTNGSSLGVFADLSNYFSTSWADFGPEGDLYLSVRANSTCCDNTLLRLDRETGVVVSEELQGDGWSMMVDERGVIHMSRNSAGPFIDRFGSESMAAFTVSLSTSSDSVVTVDFTTADGTAKIADGDFQLTSGKLTFAPGETTKTIVVPTFDDEIDEGDEEFFVSLSNPQGATIAGNGHGVGTILDDDAPVTQDAIYVYDISFDSKRGGKDWRAVFEIRTDSNANGQGDSGDIDTSGVQIEVTFAGQTYTGTTDSNGVFRTSWIRNIGNGDYYANAIDLALAGFEWNPLDLDLEDDSDGDGLPDELLQIP